MPESRRILEDERARKQKNAEIRAAIDEAERKKWAAELEEWRVEFYERAPDKCADKRCDGHYVHQYDLVGVCDKCGNRLEL